jgi:glutathione S-transferase
MHGGFAALRNDCGMGPDHTMVGPDRSPPPKGEAVERDIRRIVSLWMEMRARFGTGGPWLFGEWSVPDAFFTPVAARFRHYQIDLAAHGDDGSAAAYRDALLGQPDFLEWSAEALSNR